jgi:hypothetical protein
METIKKLALALALVATPCAQTIGPKHGLNEFEKAAGRTILASLLINAAAACTKDNFLPMKAFVPAAAIMGAGMGALGYLDDRALKKNPFCKSNKRNSRILQGVVVAAGLTPIVLSNSQSGKMLRDVLKPAGEYAIKAGTAFLDAVLLGLTSGR